MQKPILLDIIIVPALKRKIHLGKHCNLHEVLQNQSITEPVPN
jgi:hypothetical protein